MPQIDKVTFLSIIFWITILYIFQYLLLSISHLYIFVSSFKLKIKRIIFNLFLNRIISRQLRILLFFPWIYDFDATDNV